MTKNKKSLGIFFIFVFSSGIFGWAEAQAQREVEDGLRQAHRH
jgi:hypothetical protein